MALQQVLMHSVDAFYAARPRRRPGAGRLGRARLVAHRGAHGPNRPENTLAAFDAALAAGVWGVELDLRWSADLEAVVLHDSDCRRVFGHGAAPAELSQPELRRRAPQVPSLGEVIGRYGKRLHLMIEIKSEAYPRPHRQSEHLAALLSDLSPVVDYHLLALDPALFSLFPWAEPAACVVVSQTNTSKLSRTTLQKGYGAFTGHYFLLGKRRLRRHQSAGQQVGVGFPASRNNLMREINRGVDWIFTDHALTLRSHLVELRRGQG